MQEVENSLANWTHSLKELQTMKADLSQHILAEDVTVLKEQIELLHRQWEDLCLRVSQSAAYGAVQGGLNRPKAKGKNPDFAEAGALRLWAPSASALGSLCLCWFL